MKKKLKIVSVSAELAPFSKTGGLADVARSLPRALKRLGHDALAVSVYYGKLMDHDELGLELMHENIELYINSVDKVKVNYWRGWLMDGLPAYFIESKKFFSASKNIYGLKNDNERFMVFDVAVLKLLSLLKYKADIIQCHDWHAGLIPFYLKTDFRYSKTLEGAKTIFTIHNLAFQFGQNWWEVEVEKKDYGRARLPHFDSSDIQNINFAKRAIMTADAINTVSETYRDEILTKNFGQDLHRILRHRNDRLFGIVNGIDHKQCNPARDQSLFQNYDHTQIGRKKSNKERLQKILRLDVDHRIPLLVSTSRVTFQKGFELMMPTFDHLMEYGVQIIVMGDGDKKYISDLKKYAKKYPQSFVWLPFQENSKLETMLYAGADIFLLPSHHEPCGINQLIAMRYGCIPVVRRVGGLHDTVEDYDSVTGEGTGFVFRRFDPVSFFGAVIRALEAYKNQKKWKALVERDMRKSSSWEIPAQQYVELFKDIIKG